MISLSRSLARFKETETPVVDITAKSKENCIGHPTAEKKLTLEGEEGSY